MNLTRLAVLILGTALTIPAWAQTNPAAPSLTAPTPAAPEVVATPILPIPVPPKPFDASQYKLLLNRTFIVRPGGPLTRAPQIVMCAAARVVKPSPAIDPQIIGPGPRFYFAPTEARSRDLAEMNVPAPSCAELAPPPSPNPTPEKR